MEVSLNADSDEEDAFERYEPSQESADRAFADLMKKTWEPSPFSVANVWLDLPESTELAGLTLLDTEPVSYTHLTLPTKA